MTVKFKRTDTREPKLPAPQYQTPQAAGLDICSREDVTLRPGESRTVPTGWAMELPQGYVAQVCPRSGLAAKHGVTVLNSPGIIDADYRGEIVVILVNHGGLIYGVMRGDRIAQLVILRACNHRVKIVDELTETSVGSAQQEYN